GLFGLATLLFVLRTLSTSPASGLNNTGTATLRFGLAAAAITSLFALMAFVWSFLSIPASYSGRAYYELLFWGGGHLLQFAYTLLMLVAWLWLASASGVRLAISARIAKWLLALGFLPVLAAPYAYFAYGVASSEHVAFFTLQM